jgi:hypothetical protein
MLLSSPVHYPNQDFDDNIMGLNYFPSSTVVLPPINPLNHFGRVEREGAAGGAMLSPSPSAFANQHLQQQQPTKKFVSKYPPPPALNYLARSSNGVVGRKRSRDDNDNDDTSGEDEVQASSRPIMFPPPVRSEPMLGPGMTLVYPNQQGNLNISPESQSGTWMEDKPSLDGRPRMISRKSQRRVASGESAFGFNPNAMDPIVLQLGIGWKRLSDSQEPSIRGSEAFIKNQYSVMEPRIMLHHEGLAVYVVRTEPASAAGYWSQWWLFREDLKSCRFLCNDESQLFRRLSNKRMDERGNWIPEIMAEGPEVRAKDMATAGEVLPPSPGFAAVCDAQQPMDLQAQQPQLHQQPQQSFCEDVEMEM